MITNKIDIKTEIYQTKLGLLRSMQHSETLFTWITLMKVAFSVADTYSLCPIRLSTLYSQFHSSKRHPEAFSTY